MQMPMVYVARDAEYKRLEFEQPPTADMLNALAKEGWQVLQILPHEGMFYVYFVR